MTSVTGESLHPDLVNFDILAKQNYERFKARMLGEETLMQRLYIEPSDESVEKLSKAEMVDALKAKITSTTSGVERERASPKGAQACKLKNQGPTLRALGRHHGRCGGRVRCLGIVTVRQCSVKGIGPS